MGEKSCPDAIRLPDVAPDDLPLASSMILELVEAPCNKICEICGPDAIRLPAVAPDDPPPLGTTKTSCVTRLESPSSGYSIPPPQYSTELSPMNISSPNCGHPICSPDRCCNMSPNNDEEFPDVFSLPLPLNTPPIVEAIRLETQCNTSSGSTEVLPHPLNTAPHQLVEVPLPENYNR